MYIRKATYHDAPVIKTLLGQLGYHTRLSVLVDQLDRLFGSEDHQVYVCERNNELVGFTTVHYLPQLGFDGGIAVISDVSVDETQKEQDIAAALEKYVRELARKRNCERIMVLQTGRLDESADFYAGQGYEPWSGCFIKYLPN